MQNVVLWLRDLENAGGPRKPAREDLDTGLDEPGLSFISSLLWLPVDLFPHPSICSTNSRRAGGGGLSFCVLLFQVQGQSKSLPGSGDGGDGVGGGGYHPGWT